MKLLPKLKKYQHKHNFCRKGNSTKTKGSIEAILLNPWSHPSYLNQERSN